MKDLKDLFHRGKDGKRSKDDTADTSMGTRPGDVPHTALQPGIDQTLQGAPGQASAHSSKPVDTQTTSKTGPVGRAELLPKAPALHDVSQSPKDVTVDIAKPRVSEKPQDVIAPTTPNSTLFDPKDAGYSPLKESVPPASTSGMAAAKPAVTDVGAAGPSDFTFNKKPITAGAGASKPADSSMGLQQKDHKPYEGEMEPLIKKAFPNELDQIKPKEAPTGKADKDFGKMDLGMGKDDKGVGKMDQDKGIGKMDKGIGKMDKGIGKMDKDKGMDTANAQAGKGDTSSTSQKSDYTSALDKITDSSNEATSKASDNAKGVAASAAEYITSGARTIADKARQVQESADKGNLGSDISDTARGTAQVASDKVNQAGGAARDAAAQGLGAAQEALDTGKKPGSGSGSAGGQKREFRTTPADDGRSVLEKAQEALANAAAIVQDKTSQAYQAAQQKLHETGVPQKVADHSAAAQDVASKKFSEYHETATQKLGEYQDTAAQKLNEYSTEAQAHAQVAQDLAAQKLAEGKFHAQEAARIGQQKAAELASNVQNMSAEDVNRSTVGRSLGGILLLWLASYALGIPFKFSAAIALLAISAVLFLDWDRRRHGRGRAGRYGTGLGGASQETRVTHERKHEEHMITSFGPIKLHAGRFEEGPTGTKFIAHGNVHLIKEE